MSRVYAQHWKDYELIDAGDGQKLERWGNIVTIRPEPNAYFKAVLSKREWEDRAHLRYKEVGKKSGKWEFLRDFDPKNWQIEYKGVKLNLKLTQFKHLGVFPEQQLNWEYIHNHIDKDDRFLNLFAYTGAASLVARSRGADVFHCDSVRQVISWANENMESSGLDDIHWILEDALKFARREVKRGNRYKGVIMDPPAYGIGAKKERWKIEDKFDDLMAVATQLLDDEAFLLVNTYSPRLTKKEIEQIVPGYFPNDHPEVDTLCLKSTTGKRLEYGVLTKVERHR